MTTSQMPTVFVCSATGSQGGALCYLLRELGWNVRGITRDLNSHSSKSLQAAGVHLMPGDWDNEDALSLGLAGCDKLYLCLLPNFADLDQMPTQADRIVRVARAAGVRHAVVSTTLGVSWIEEGSKPPIAPGPFFARHLEAMRRKEQAVVQGGFDHWTVIRPAFFMANFTEPKINLGFAEIKDKGTWTNCMTPSTKFGLIDHVDISRFAAAAFQHPVTYQGRSIAITGEEVLIQDLLNQVAEAVGDGRSMRAIFMTDEQIAKAQTEAPWGFFAAEPIVRYMSETVDMDELHRLIPGLMSFEKYLQREMKAVKETYRT